MFRFGPTRRIDAVRGVRGGEPATQPPLSHRSCLEHFRWSIHRDGQKDDYCLMTSVSPSQS